MSLSSTKRRGSGLIRFRRGVIQVFIEKLNTRWKAFARALRLLPPHLQIYVLGIAQLLLFSHPQLFEESLLRDFDVVPVAQVV